MGVAVVVEQGTEVAQGLPAVGVRAALDRAVLPPLVLQRHGDGPRNLAQEGVGQLSVDAGVAVVGPVEANNARFRERQRA